MVCPCSGASHSVIQSRGRAALSFGDPPLRVMKIKTKVNKWDLIKLKSFCPAEENHKQNEKTTYKMGKNIAHEAVDKRLISKIWKCLLQVAIKKSNKPTTSGQKI